MTFYVLTLFTDMVLQGLNHSVIKRGIDKGIIDIKAIDIRDFAKNRHRHVDDYGYGDGVGMVMQAQPIYDAYMSIKERLDSGTKVLYMSPQGKVFNQKMAEELAKEKNLVLLCGHYEGVDQRVLEEIGAEEVSVGDFVLTGGELPAMCIIDSVSRLIKGVLNKEESFMDESFSDGLLEYPQYTRPYDFMGRLVPDVLLSGNHGEVARWKRRQSIINTFKKRPELLENAELTQEEINFIKQLKNE